VAIATSACAAIEGLGTYDTKPGGDAGGATDAPVTDVSTSDLGVGSEVSGEENVAGEDAPSDVAHDGTTDADGMVALEDDGPVSTDDAPAYDAGNCTTAMVDTVHGVFVAPTGTDPPDGGTCGLSASSPCLTIGAGLASAKGVHNIVYVSAGRYTEKLTLVGGVTVQGGWTWQGGSNWSFSCSPNPESLVVVQAPTTSNQTVVASSNNGMTGTLSTLTVLSKPAAQPGESLYGVYATGMNTVLALTDVVVTVAAGGAGAPGIAGATGSTPSGACTAADGHDAGAATGGTPGAAGAAGTFSSTGFTAHAGGMGGNGAAGDNGMAGGAGSTTQYSVCATASPCTNGQNNCVGGTGQNGCGGGGGSGGTGGAGGGSSVAVFAYQATVTITAGGYQAGNGGAGGAGGAAGPGASGTPGATGLTSDCPPSACSDAGAMLCILLNTTFTAAGGLAGGPGGSGSAGGQGGGGAGGNSYAIVTGGAATTTLTLSPSNPPTLEHGNGGAGAGGSASGTGAVQTTF